MAWQPPGNFTDVKNTLKSVSSHWSLLSKVIHSKYVMELQSRVMFSRTKDQLTYLDLHCSKMTAKVAKSLNPPAFAANSRCLCSASFWYSGSTKRQIKRQFSFKSSAYIHFAFLFNMFNKICLTLEVELN